MPCQLDITLEEYRRKRDHCEKNNFLLSKKYRRKKKNK